MVLVYSFRKKMFLKKIEQQIGLSASANAGDDLNKAVVLLADEPIQVGVSFHYHVLFLLLDIFAGTRSFVQ